MIAFIGCSKTKKEYSCKARDFYQGVLFKKSLAYSERNYKQVYILSAKYGVVGLEQVLSPYDITLSKMKKEERLKWYEMVKKQLQELNLKPPYIFLTGSLYKGDLPGDELFKNLPFGKRLQWLNNQMKNTQKRFI